MLLEIICLVLFACLVVYFVVTFIVISKYKRMKKLALNVKRYYVVFNTKAYSFGRNLCLFENGDLDISSLRESFESLYDEVYLIADEVYKGDL